MALTAQQLKERKFYIGASEAGAIVGVNPYQSIYDVWLSKAQGVELETWEGNEATDLGNQLEPVAIRLFEEREGIKVKRNVFLQVPEGDPQHFMAANLDGLGADGNPVEAKTAGLASKLNRDDWGEEGSDHVPMSYWVQVQHQMAVMALVNGKAPAFAWLPAILGGIGFRVYKIPYHAEFISELCKRELAFWTENVLGNVPPSGAIANLGTLTRIIRTPKSEIALADDLVRDFQEKNRISLDASRVMTEAKKKLIAALGTAEIGRYSGGVVTYFERDKKGYTVAPTKYRQLDIKEDRNND